MDIKIALDNGGGELDSQVVEVRHGADEDAIARAIQDVISAWTLSVGDTITIREI